MADTPISLAELNGYGLLKFTETLLPLYGSAGWIPALAHAQRPFTSIDHLHRALGDIVASADPGTKEQLLQGQPEPLDAAREGIAFTEEERALLQKNQVEYLKKFSFPLVLSVASLDPAGRADLLPSVAARLANSREQEVTNSLDEAAKLARVRLGQLVAE